MYIDGFAHCSMEFYLTYNLTYNHTCTIKSPPICYESHCTHNSKIPSHARCSSHVIRCDGHPDCEDWYDEQDCENYDPEEAYGREHRRQYYGRHREQDEFDGDYNDDDEDYDDYGAPEDEFDARLDLTDEEREEYAEYRREMMIRDRERRTKRSAHAPDGLVHQNNCLIVLCVSYQFKKF